MLLAMGAIWGFGFAAQQMAMTDIGPFLFIGLRFLLAGLAVAPLAWLEGQRSDRRIDRRDISQFTVLGLVFFVALAMQQVGLLGTTITNAGFLTTLYVLLVPTLAMLVFGQRPPKLIWPAACASLLGVFLLSAGDFGNLTWGDGLVVSGAFVWALHVILVGRTARSTARPVATACAQFFFAGTLGCIANVAAGILGWNLFPTTWHAILRAAPEVLYAGLISGALAFTLQSVAQRYTSSSVAVVLMSTESLFAAATGIILLGESLRPVALLGGLLIVFSVVLVELASLKRDTELASLKRDTELVSPSSDTEPTSSNASPERP